MKNATTAQCYYYGAVAFSFDALLFLGTNLNRCQTKKIDLDFSFPIGRFCTCIKHTSVIIYFFNKIKTGKGTIGIHNTFQSAC